jgi:hypothetical protein
MASALTYASTAPGMAKVFREASAYVQTSRAGAAPMFSAAARKAVLEEDAPVEAKPATPVPAAQA